MPHKGLPLALQLSVGSQLDGTPFREPIARGIVSVNQSGMVPVTVVYPAMCVQNDKCQLNEAACPAAEGISVEAPVARAASGQLGMRQRRSTRSAARARSPTAAAGASGRAKGISGGVGLDTPYEWGEQ